MTIKTMAHSFRTSSEAPVNLDGMGCSWLGKRLSLPQAGLERVTDLGLWIPNLFQRIV